MPFVGVPDASTRHERAEESKGLSADASTRHERAEESKGLSANQRMPSAYPLVALPAPCAGPVLMVRLFCTGWSRACRTFFCL
jgi:hypothetical protein